MLASLPEPTSSSVAVNVVFLALVHPIEIRFHSLGMMAVGVLIIVVVVVELVVVVRVL